MKVTRNWLKQYVEFNRSPEELTERLTMLGLEVEGVRKFGGAHPRLELTSQATPNPTLALQPLTRAGIPLIWLR
jgi:hypothetical protein